jgi:dihydrofolate reductase
MLLGRKTYEGLAQFWPTQSGPWADRMNVIPKFVASRSARSAGVERDRLRYQPI